MDQANLIHGLFSDKCRCGRTKKYGTTFCTLCYFKLPGNMRNALYTPVGDGYEEAVADAIKYLDE